MSKENPHNRLEATLIKKRKRSRGGLYRRDGILCFRYKDRAGEWHEKSTGETNRSAAADFKTDYRRAEDGSLLPTRRSGRRAAVEKLDGIRQAPRFVEDFVEEAADEKLNLLN